VKQIIFSGILFIFLLAFTSCKKEVQDKWDDTMNSGLIRIACDEGLKPLMDAEIAVFEGLNLGAVILPIYTNETEAIRLLTEDSVRFALTTRDLNAKEQAAIRTLKLKTRKYLVAFDGIALIINQQNRDSIIGMPTLRKILAGEITGWPQMNPDSPLGTIRIIIDNQESGILRYIVDSIAQGAALTSNIYAMNNDADVIEKVIQMPNTIGLIGVNALTENDQDKVRLLRLSREEPARLDNSYLPYAGDIRQENYPLWRPVYVLLSDPKSGLSSGLSVFMSNEIGQKIILKAGLLPVTDSQNRLVNIKDEYPK
jgi:phosphate transport system substrate-binding protein